MPQTRSLSAIMGSRLASTSCQISSFFIDVQRKRCHPWPDARPVGGSCPIAPTSASKAAGSAQGVTSGQRPGPPIELTRQGLRHRVRLRYADIDALGVAARLMEGASRDDDALLPGRPEPFGTDRIWMLHCHLLIHAAFGLSTIVSYEGSTTPYVIGSKSGHFRKGWVRR